MLSGFPPWEFHSPKDESTVGVDSRFTGHLGVSGGWHTTFTAPLSSRREAKPKGRYLEWRRALYSRQTFALVGRIWLLYKYQRSALGLTGRRRIVAAGYAHFTIIGQQDVTGERTCSYTCSCLWGDQGPKKPQFLAQESIEGGSQWQSWDFSDSKLSSLASSITKKQIRRVSSLYHVDFYLLN